MARRLIKGHTPRSVRRNIGRLKARGVPERSAIHLALTEKERAKRAQRRRSS